MFRSRTRTLDEPQSSLTSGMASIISGKPCQLSPPLTPQDVPEDYFEHHNPIIHAPVSPIQSPVDLKPRQINAEPLTLEAVSAIIASAVHMSTSGGAPSSLSSGMASIVPKNTSPTHNSPEDLKPSRRRFFSIGWKSKNQDKQVQRELSDEASQTSGSSKESNNGSPRSSSASATSPYNSPRLNDTLSTPPVESEFHANQNLPDDGRDELIYRGIQIKEIKTTLKTMVIPDHVRNPVTHVKLERPGFARINY
ncbi:hypothetical protein J3Q64DRAFT_1696428 [Phycomyces blakesleeanus]|uniref:Uncharacterized protein n=2 Tax=Phycomyces blakesleeanus TaxID=4837 RepID=A0A163A098_PHYB8|nr:hypothetical protein PHYBLDRAFT_171565 [Phycomyces blakesleeanus NRRL 1555(-)]OAD70181.1 hypothetical protein PHYBLDRAFT_171565 [Phycomyces blakesleeanus NRRL 1555(-)]|eukprot:XP_018288221.1 hypothetical protein PHYBLDRAFT_171565 [Phycomyces blakesleeanus NRRL 1555(-)]